MGSAACWGSQSSVHHVSSKHDAHATAFTKAPSLEEEESMRSVAPKTPHHRTTAVIELLLTCEKRDGAAMEATATEAAPALSEQHDCHAATTATQDCRPISHEAATRPLMLLAQFGCEQPSTAANLADRSPTLRSRDADRSFSVLSRSSPSVTFAEIVFIARPDPQTAGPPPEEGTKSVSLSAAQRPCSVTNDLQRPDAFASTNSMNDVMRCFSSQCVTKVSSTVSDVQPSSPCTSVEGSSVWVDTVSLDDHCAEGMRYALPIRHRRYRRTPGLPQRPLELRTTPPDSLRFCMNAPMRREKAAASSVVE